MAYTQKKRGMKPMLGNFPHGCGDAEEVSGGAAVDGPHAQRLRCSRPAATAKGKLWPSGSCWASDGTRGHRRETWKKDGRVSPESEFRFTALQPVTSRGVDSFRWNQPTASALSRVVMGMKDSFHLTLSRCRSF